MFGGASLVWNSGSEGVVLRSTASASPGSLLEMQMIALLVYPRLNQRPQGGVIPQVILVHGRVEGSSG